MRHRFPELLKMPVLVRFKTAKPGSITIPTAAVLVPSRICLGDRSMVVVVRLVKARHGKVGERGTDGILNAF